jgi:hypothetical protein
MTSSRARPLPSPNFCVIPWKNFSKWHPGRSAPLLTSRGAPSQRGVAGRSGALSAKGAAGIIPKTLEGIP